MADEFKVKKGLIVNELTYANTDAAAKTVLTTDGLGTITLQVIDAADVTGLPTNVSDFTNDSGFITGIVTQDEGSAVITATTMNFVGNGVVLSNIGGVATITVPGGTAQNIFETFTGDTGTTSANTATDTLTISGGTNVTTSITGDVLTIDAAGVTTFVGLTDTPGDFTAAGGKYLAVNAGATAVEYVDAPASGGGTTARIKINYNSSGNINTIDAASVPAGWTVTNSGNVLSVTYTELYPPISITYAGMNLSTGTFKYRQPTSANEAQFDPTAFGTSGTTMTMDIPFNVMGGNAAAPPFFADGYVILRF